MGFILLLLFAALIFRTGLGLVRFLIPILIFLFILGLIVHLWWIILLIIPFMFLANRGRRRQPVANNTENKRNTVDGQYDEVDD